MTNYTWNNNGGGDYLVAANWSPTGVPRPSDNATIAGGVVVTDANTLGVDGGSLTLTGPNTQTLTGPNTQLQAQSAVEIGIANHGPSVLSVLDGAQLLSSGSFYSNAEAPAYDVIGVQTGSNGSATVDGSGSAWNSTSDGLTVGQGGSGTLTLSNGGSVSVQNSFDVGLLQGGSGTVTIGTGDTLSAAGTTAVGDGGVGEIDINAGGSLLGTGSVATFASEVDVGLQPGSTGTIKVTGAGVRLDTGGNPLYVGDSGTGTLTVSQGGKANSGTSDSSMQAAIGVGGASGGIGTVTVTGAGSSLTAAGFGFVGRGGTGTMVVSNSAQATLGDSTYGFEVGSGYYFQGTFQTGGSGDLQVASSASVDVLSYLSVGTGGDHGTVEIGTSGALSAAGSVTVGNSAGSVGEIDVNAGGSLLGTGSAASFASKVRVGRVAGATGTIKVTGARALLDSGGNPMLVGDFGSGTLTVNQGGTVKSGTSDSSLDSALGVGGGAGATGTITVTGAGSSLMGTGFGYVGRGGTGTMVVSDSAQATLGDAANRFDVGGGGSFNGASATGGSGKLQVTANGLVHVLSNLVVGNRGDTGTLEVDQNGLVTAAGAIGIGDGNTTYGAGTGTVTVGPGGTLRAALDPTLLPQYQNGPGASIYLGNTPGAVGTLNVTGAGAHVDANGNKISVGSNNQTSNPGGTGFLTVSQGATVDSAAATSVDQALVVASSAANVGTVTVTDAGSVFNARGEILLGNSGQGNLVVENGGVLNSGQSNGANTSNGLYIGSNMGSTGYAQVTGSGSKITNFGGFVVGGSGVGQLTISAGAEVSTQEGSNAGLAAVNDFGAAIGYKAGSSGSNVTVTGQESSWNVTGALEVGSRGAGSLVVANGGQVAAGSVDIGAAGAGGDLALAGGTVAVTGNLVVGSQGLVQGSGTIDPSVTTLVAGGSYTATGLLVSPQVVDNGMIAPNGGALEVDGSIDGTGTVVVNAGDSLTLDGALNGAPGDNVSTSIDGGLLRLAPAASTSGPIDFSSGGTLEIDRTMTSGAGYFASPLTNLSAGDKIDLAGLAYANGTAPTVTVSGSLLTVTNGMASETFTLTNSGSLFFDAAKDQGTGTILTAVPALAPTITGTVPGQTTTAEAPIDPFSGVAIADPNSGATESVTIMLSGSGGVLSGNGLSPTGASGVYALAAGTAADVTAALQSLVFTPEAGAPNTQSTTTFTLSESSSAGTSASDAATTVTDTAAGLPGVLLGVAYHRQAVASGPNTFTFTGTVSATGDIAGVEIFEGAKDLGAANVDQASHAWSFTSNFKPGHHTDLTAVATGANGASIAAASSFDITTGVKGEPYRSYETSYDRKGNRNGQTFFTGNGVVYQRMSVTTNADGSSSQVTSGGSYFRSQTFDGSTQDFNAAGAPTELVLDNRDGTHSVAGLLPGMTLQSIADDTLSAEGGRNTFVFTPGFGQDTITSFVLGGKNHDEISLPEGDAARLGAILAQGSTDAYGDTTLHIDRHDTLTLAGVSISDLHKHRGDFTFHA